MKNRRDSWLFESETEDDGMIDEDEYLNYVPRKKRRLNGIISDVMVGRLYTDEYNEKMKKLVNDISKDGNINEDSLRLDSDSEEQNKFVDDNDDEFDKNVKNIMKNDEKFNHRNLYYEINQNLTSGELEIKVPNNPRMINNDDIANYFDEDFDRNVNYQRLKPYKDVNGKTYWNEIDEKIVRMELNPFRKPLIPLYIWIMKHFYLEKIKEMGEIENEANLINIMTREAEGVIDALFHHIGRIWQSRVNAIVPPISLNEYNRINGVNTSKDDDDSSNNHSNSSNSSSDNNDTKKDIDKSDPNDIPIQFTSEDEDDMILNDDDMIKIIEQTFKFCRKRKNYLYRVTNELPPLNISPNVMKNFKRRVNQLDEKNNI